MLALPPPNTEPPKADCCGAAGDPPKTLEPPNGVVAEVVPLPPKILPEFAGCAFPNPPNIEPPV